MVELYSEVALLVDLPEHNLRRGQVGTLVEEWEPGVFEVEFSDMHGMTYAMVALRADQLIPLYRQPVPTSA